MSAWQNLKAATRSDTDYWIGGVCGGLGAATPIPSWMWRAGFLFATLLFGVAVLLYIILWICMPDTPGPAGGEKFPRSDTARPPGAE